MTLPTKQKYFSDKFWDEYAYNHTFDMTELRYDGPIPVFLYGNYASWLFVSDIMVKSGLAHITDFKAISDQTCTYHKRCFLNKKRGAVDNSYSSYLIPPTVKVKGFTLTERKIRGRLFTVSLAGIRALDSHFYNGIDFTREAIRIDPESKHNISIAYTYQALTSTLSGDNSSDNKSIELKAGLELSLPVGLSNTNGEMIYI